MAQMGIGLEDFLGSLMGRTEQMSSSLNNLQIHNNVIFRLLYEKGIITENDIKDAIRMEFSMLYDLGHIQSRVPDETVDKMTNDLMDFVKCDVEKIKAVTKEYEELLKEELQKESSRIEVADPSILASLDKMPSNNKKLIL